MKQLELFNESFRLTTTGLEIKGNPDFEDWMEYGHTLKTLDGTSRQFAIGDWIVAGFDKFQHGKWEAVQQVWGGNGALGSLQNYEYVAKHVESSRRRENLSFSHHAEVADLDPNDQHDFLQLAVDKKLSVASLRDAIREEKVRRKAEEEKRKTEEEEKKSIHFSSDADDWATPFDFFELLNDEFSFTLDVCANEQNAKCSRYFTVIDNGLAQDWRGACWMNPPYGREIDQWMEKAYKSAKDGATVVCLIPARTDTGWWWNYAIKGEIRFIKGRLKFGDASNSAPFPSAVVVFYPGVSPHDEQVIWWGEWND